MSHSSGTRALDRALSTSVIGCVIDMTSPDMTYAMSVRYHDQLIDLSFLNDDERSAILEVIERDETVRRQDQVRIR